jgi:uncharacterized protein YrrD
MLRSMKSMENFSLDATDGVIGHVKDFYFDDAAWVVRYLVVETGDWLSQRRVLISPIALGAPNWADECFPVAVTQSQVSSSPSIDTDKPVSRQHESAYSGYFGYPFYWNGDDLWGGALYPGALSVDGANYDALDGNSAPADDAPVPNSKAVGAGVPRPFDPHLRSGNAVMRYPVQAADGEVGHVQGLLVDVDTWAIRYLIVDTGHWWHAHQVLIAPQWIERVDWAAAAIVIDLKRQAIEASPHYDASIAVTRELEAGTFAHYGREGYWPRESERESARQRVKR